MSDETIKRQFSAALNGYIELVHDLHNSESYFLRLNWDLADGDDPAMRMVVVGSSDLGDIERHYTHWINQDPSQQSVWTQNYYNLLSGVNARDSRWFERAQPKICQAFKDSAFQLDVEDPHQNMTYVFDGAVSAMLEKSQECRIDQAQANQLLEEIAKGFGVQAPKLYWGKRALFNAVLGGTLTIGQAVDGSSYQISEAKSIVVKDCELDTLIHEMAHHIAACASTPDVSTNHGELFNRIYLQILDKYTQADTDILFDIAQAQGLFRSKITIEDIMKPIGMLSAQPIIDPYEAEMP